MPIFSWYPLLASAAFLLLVAGLRLRKRRVKAHALLMSSGMLLDILLVAAIELERDATGTLLGGELSPPQLAHVFSSLAALGCYPILFWLGSGLLRAPEKNRARASWHRRLGYLAMGLRALGFFFMFWMLK